MIHHVDGDSYSQIDFIILTAAKAALSLFRPDLKDRGYQVPVIYVWCQLACVIAFKRAIARPSLSKFSHETL